MDLFNIAEPSLCDTLGPPEAPWAKAARTSSSSLRVRSTTDKRVAGNDIVE